MVRLELKIYCSAKAPSEFPRRIVWALSTYGKVFDGSPPRTTAEICNYNDRSKKLGAPGGPERPCSKIHTPKYAFLNLSTPQIRGISLARKRSVPPKYHVGNYSAPSENQADTNPNKLRKFTIPNFSVLGSRCIRQKNITSIDAWRII